MTEDGALSVRPPAGRPTGGLPTSALKEQFSIAFVTMVAAAAGCSVKHHTTDYDGVDITISSSSQYSTFFGPEFEMQLKCTSQQHRLTERHMAWPLERDRFLKLVNPRRYLPAVIGVLLIPDDPAAWLDLSDEGLRSHSRMYWDHAANLGRIEDDKASKTVHLPRSNIFDVAGLTSIMRRIGEGEMG